MTITTLWQTIVRGRPVAVALALVALLALAGCGGGGASNGDAGNGNASPNSESAGEAAVINVISDKAADTTEVTIEDGRAVLDVTSASGIGGLTAILNEGEWPQEIVVRLHTRGLERLEIGYANYIIETGVPSSDGIALPLMLTVVDDEGNAERISPSADIYYPDIQAVTAAGATAVGPLATGERPAIPLPEDGVFEITLPLHFHQEAYESFWMQWIDFYR
jgi:hypothetical protein